MSWNKPSDNQETQSSLRRAGTARPTLVRGIIAGCVVAIIGAAIMWLVLSPSGETRHNAASTARTRIKEVTPAAAPKPTAEPVATNLPLNVKRDHSELSREELLTKVPHWAYSVEDRKRIDPGYEKRHEKFLKRLEDNPWKTYADNALAALLFSKGSLGLLPPFNPKFRDSFLKSLETPIIATKDDPPEIQEMKRQMNETKIWLKEQLDAGEDIVKILNDEYNRKKKVYALRDTLKRELITVQKNAKSVAEVEDYVAAANIMLKNAGDTKGMKMHIIPPEERIRLESNSKRKSQNE